MRKSYLDDIPKQIQNLQDCLDAGDAPGVERKAHAIRGAAANAGGESLRETAYKMEEAARLGDLATVKAGMKELVARFEQLKEAMGNELSKNAPANRE